MATYTVTSLLDVPVNPADDATVFTLREAIIAANASAGVNDTIQFAPALFASGVPATITLSNLGPLSIAANSGITTIIGPGAHLLSISGNSTGRIVNIPASASADIRELTFRNGSANRGGAIENLGTLAVANSAFESNATTTGDGGAIFNSGTLTVTGSTFSANTAIQSAGAIGVYFGGTATLVNSTFSGNAARLFGGAIDVNSSTATIINSTIVLNQAQSLSGGTGNGGGISNFGTVTLHNTIVAGNTMLTTNVPNDLANTSVQSTSSNNLIGNAASRGGLVHNTNGNIVGNAGSGTLLLSSIINTTLTNNGGNTLTHALQPGSPATDGGNNSLATVSIPRLFRSGEGAAINSADPNFQLVSAPPGAGSTALAIQRNPAWVANSSGTQWIGVNNSGLSNAPVGEYIYRLTFDLTGLDPSTAALSGTWAADDGGAIRLNGTPTAVTSPSFNVLSAFSISTGFVAGLNTLDFVVTNGGAGPNPTGLLVNSLSGTARLLIDQRGAGSPRIRGSSIDIGAVEAGRTIIDLSNHGPAGTTIFGADAYDQSGYSVSSAGDINGDGFDDLLIGARAADASGNLKSAAGDSYVIFGAASLPATIDLSTLGSAGITIFGADANDFSGSSVSSAGDINGDGFDDLLIGARYAGASGNAKSSAGDSYVIFGAASLPATIDLNTLGSAGITIFGAEADDQSGISVSSAGDVNGDGFDDLVIGARSADASGNAKSAAGDSYVIFGAASLPATIDLANLGTAGITIFGADADDFSGSSVSSAGDVNGDGFDDLLIGAYRADASGNTKSVAGDSYVIFGAASLPATIDLNALGSAGVTIFGAEVSDTSGSSVSSAGDVNGDGFDDLLIGANRADASGNAKYSAGDSYVIFGNPSLPATIDLNTLGSAGVTIFGADGGDRSGFSVSSAGDVNGDGFDDLLIGAPYADASGNAKLNAGDSYVFFGAASLPATIDLANLGAAGVTIFGADAVDFSGSSVSSAGDVNGDGFDDLLIGARFADASGNAKNSAGDSYVLFGGNGFTNSILPAYLGGSGASSLLGDASANRINGGGGNDIVSGGGGADVLLGGQGNDIFIINDASFQRIVGGTGRDSLWLNNPTSVGFTLNLTNIADNRLQDIEEIDISGFNANNTLTLNQREVLNISNSNNTLTVLGNAGDRVVIETGWNRQADNGGFQILTKRAATLRVSTGVSIEITPVIDLANLGIDGTTIVGAEANDQSGFSVSNAGDVNGDGFDDFVIGARSADASGNAKSYAGDSYVIFGAASLPATIDLANLGSAGITIFGADVGDFSGRSVSNAGDVNGDGFDDLLIEAYGADASGNAKSFAGDSYVIFGAASLPATIDLANLGSAGVTIFGADAGDTSGISVSSAGDVNGDGFDDLVIGARSADASGNAKSSAGDSYVIFGAASLPATIDLANLGSAGITIFGADVDDFSGRSVSSAGDVNGDGFDDLLIGAYGADASGNAKSSAGDSYVIFGAASLPATIDLANLGTAGVTIFGADADDFSGSSVSSAGDVNGDGFDDLIIGAYGADASGNAKSSAGDSYVIFGAASLPATVDLANLGTAGITIFGADVGDFSGSSVSSAGDVNGDGFDDLIIGARAADASGNAKSSAGDSYVIFGAASLPATIDLIALGSTGVTIFGADADDRSGSSVSSAGDVNGDGFDDLLIGAYRADASGNAKSVAGDSYLLFGGNGFTNSILPAYLGGSGASSLLGDASANRINGGGGNDIVSGGGGADVLLGGQGNDIFIINDASFQRIVGGTGRDSLWLNNPTNVGFTLNLTTIPDNRLQDIEEIDISGLNANNTLILNHREVLNLSDKSNTLVVRQNTGDVVNIGSGWTYAGAETIGLGTFDVFTQGQATLKLQRVSALIAARSIFYNNATGANLSSVGAANNAIASDKRPLLPGNASTFANYTNYSRGLNGIIVDIAGLPATTTNSQILANLQFAQWNGISAAGFAALPGAAVPTATILAGSGVGGSARVKITFPDNTLQNTWLRVTVLANANTGLTANDVFYFGNVIGELDFGNTATRLRVNGQDAALILANQSPGANSAAVTNKFDLDRNGRVNGQDYALLLANQQAAGIVAPITAPSARSAPAARSLSTSSTMGAVPFELPSGLKKERRGDSEWDSVDAYFAELWKSF